MVLVVLAFAIRPGMLDEWIDWTRLLQENREEVENLMGQETVRRGICAVLPSRTELVYIIDVDDPARAAEVSKKFDSKIATKHAAKVRDLLSKLGECEVLFDFTSGDKQ